MAVFRGEGGEIERRPNKPTQVWTSHGSDAPVVETWPQLLPEGHQPPDPDMALERLVDVWRGTLDDAYAREAIIGTIAVTLRTMGKAGSIARAEADACALWEARDKARLPVQT